MKKLLLLFVIILAISLINTSCSFKTHSYVSVDTVSAKNFHVEKKDSLTFKPF